MKAALWVILLGATLVGAGPLCRAADAPRPLDRAARQRLDRVALVQPPETLAQERINRVGNMPAWLLSNAGLPERDAYSPT